MEVHYLEHQWHNRCLLLVLTWNHSTADVFCLARPAAQQVCSVCTYLDVQQHNKCALSGSTTLTAVNQLCRYTPVRKPLRINCQILQITIKILTLFAVHILDALSRAHSHKLYKVTHKIHVEECYFKVNSVCSL